MYALQHYPGGLMKASTLRHLAGFAVFIGIWQFLSTVGWINPVLLPSPERLVGATWELLEAGILVTHTLACLWRGRVGFLLASAVGIGVENAEHSIMLGRHWTYPNAVGE